MLAIDVGFSRSGPIDLIKPEVNVTMKNVCCCQCSFIVPLFVCQLTMTRKIKYRVIRLSSTSVLLGIPSNAMTSVELAKAALCKKHTAQDDRQDQHKQGEKHWRQDTSNDTSQDLLAKSIALEESQPRQPAVRVRNGVDT